MKPFWYDLTVEDILRKMMDIEKLVNEFKFDLGMHFIQPPQDIVVKILQKLRISEITDNWLSQVHTQKTFYVDRYEDESYNKEQYEEAVRYYEQLTI